MTVSYSGEVANGSSFGCFWRILCRWRGSVYKLIWRELLVYLGLFFAISVVYRYALDSHQKRSLALPTDHEDDYHNNVTNSSKDDLTQFLEVDITILRIFEKVQNYFATHGESIPMSFVLGFYVTLIVKRWWEQYRLLPWPDSLALFVSAAIPGVDERGRLMRRNIVRYAMLSYVITLQNVSFRVKKRFPTWQHIVDAGLMMESEKKIFEMMDEKTTMSKYWMPLIWATNIINRARKEGLILNDHVVQTILVELSDIRKRLGSLIGYDTVCVPLVYTQVVTLSVYTYFLAALVGQQFINTDPETPHPDMFVPVFTVLQFCFYVGWLKVAEVLINPFGEDDDDIELNWLIDRHLKAAYMIVDEMHEEHPELLKDQYWEEVVPKDLPYTLASEHYRRAEPKGSAENYKVKESDALYANLLPNKKVAPDDVYADYESVDTPMVERRKNWFQRQLNRMGSVRSSSTTYSSGLFGRGRHNSVYSSPEAGPPAPPAANPHHGHKMSLYERIVGRNKSMRNRGASRHGTTKMNGSAVPVALKNRPRIPTPDVTKEVVDRENKLAIMNSGGGSVLVATHPSTLAHQSPHHHRHHHAAAPTSYPSMGDMPVVQVMLSPIQELEGNNGPGHQYPQVSTSGNGGTAALAQAVLSPALTTAGINSVTLAGAPTAVLTTSPMAMSTMTLTPVTISQPLLPSLGTSSLHLLQHAPTVANVTSASPATLTEVNSGSEEENGNMDSLTAPNSTPAEDRSRKTSAASNTAKRGEVYV